MQWITTKLHCYHVPNSSNSNRRRYPGVCISQMMLSDCLLRDFRAVMLKAICFGGNVTATTHGRNADVLCMDACASCEACEARTCLLAPLPALENHTGQAIVFLVPRRAPSNCMHAALPVAERAQASIPGRVRQAFGSDPRYRLDVGHLQSTTPRLASQRR